MEYILKPLPEDLSQVAAIVVDLESTGLSPTVDEIFNLSVVGIDENYNPLFAYDYWGMTLNKILPPKLSIKLGITLLDIITLSRNTMFIEEIPNILNLLSMFNDKVFIAQNAKFDKSFLFQLNSHTHDHNIVFSPDHTLDTLALYRSMHNGPANLDAQMKELNISKTFITMLMKKHYPDNYLGRHSGLYDVTCTLQVLKKLAGLKGGVTIHELSEHYQ